MLHSDARRSGDNALSEALSEASAAYAERNPASRQAHDQAARYLPGGNTRSVLHYDPFPLTMVRGEDCRLWDADGHVYTDFLGEFTAGIYGHSNPLIIEAITKAASGGLNMGSQTPRECELAEIINGRFPSMELIRFTNSGTEANLMAVSLAKTFTGRAKIMVFTGAYHGGVLTFPKGDYAVNVPHDYIMAEFNDVEATRALVREHGTELAAVLVEPMMGSGGCIPGDPEFLQMLRDETRDAGALLIFDEVMTSRLSRGGRQAILKITPDLTTLGKYIGGGMSVGAFGGVTEIMSLFDPRRRDGLSHAGTVNNNAITMAAGIVGLRDVYTAEAASVLNRRGDHFRETLNAAFATANLPLCAAGIGSLLNLHPVADVPQRPENLAGVDQRIRDLIFFDLLEDGFYFARRGLIALSLPLGDDAVDAFVSAVRARLPRWQSLFGLAPH